MANITQLLEQVQAGDPKAFEELYDVAYAELRRIARAHVRSRSRSTLGTTALVNEAYIRLFDRSSSSFNDRSHFFAVSARAMRQILVDHFRGKTSQKRGGGEVVLVLDEELIPTEDRGELILAVHQALERLAGLDARLASVVEYKFFGGMTQEEIAAVLDLTTRTVSSDWRRARAWLAHELRTTSPRPGA